MRASISTAVLWICLVVVGGCAGVPAGEPIAVPVQSIGPETPNPAAEWQYFVGTARRVGRILAVDMEHKADSLRIVEGRTQIKGTVLCSGVPCRNETLELELVQHDQPIVLLLRSTDAFGEVFVLLDLHAGRATARSVTVTREMTGESTPSPRPRESADRVIAEAEFPPPGAGSHRLHVREHEQRITLAVDERVVFAFDDPDVAGGHYGVGSTGTVSVGSVRQCELVVPAELRRRERCVREMTEFSEGLDRDFDGEVQRANQVHREGESLIWSFSPTRTQVTLTPRPGQIKGTLRTELYGGATLLTGGLPDLEVHMPGGEVLRPASDSAPRAEGDSSGLSLSIPLTGTAGTVAAAEVRIRFTIHPVWFWRVTVRGAEPARVQAMLTAGPDAGPVPSGPPGEVPNLHGKPAKRWLQSNGRSGFYVQTCEPDTVVGPRAGSDTGRQGVIVSGNGSSLAFGTLWLPAQPLNPVGFTRRMVHFIRYTLGSVQQWREGPSSQEYPSDAEIDDYADHGTEAMVWHHTWTSNDHRRREGFIVNDREMSRAMEHCRRRGIEVITYLGIVPGRSPLLRYEDLAARYDKNWDLQDFAFYATAGRWQHFLPWMTDQWCRKYRLDGFYVDGALGLDGSGILGTLRSSSDAGGLTQDELTYRLYWRVRKVLRQHGARFGFENWGGSPITLVTPFYDCRMIGEAFQRARPEDYRDGYNVLLTGTTFKMYGMRDTSRDHYNIAMAAINLSDIQICSGNKAWGCDPIAPQDWQRVGAFWRVLETVEFADLVEAMPWWAQQLVTGEGLYAAHYTQSRRVLVFLANRTDQAGRFTISIDRTRLPASVPAWQVRRIYPQIGEPAPLGDGRLPLDVPGIESGPVALELTPLE